MPSLLSRYRAQLMALAMFGILATHTKTSFSCFFVNRLLLLGQGGVDMFFFLSGFGLYFSGRKMTSAAAFYRKRFTRIFPAFLLILAITLLVNHQMKAAAFFWGGTTLAYWMWQPQFHRYMFGWFVSAITLLYLLFPSFFKWFRRQPKTATLAGILAGLAATAIYAYYFLVLHPGSYNHYILTVARIPVFFMGIYAGFIAQRIRQTGVYPRRLVIWTIVLAAITLAAYNSVLSILGFMTMRNSGLLYLPFAVIMPGFCLLAAYLLKQAERLRIGRRLLAFLGSLGTCTLEAYLLLGITFKHIDQLAKQYGLSPTANFLLQLAITVALAWVLHKCIGFVIGLPSRLHRSRNPQQSPI